jgi:hypothetical protein
LLLLWQTTDWFDPAPIGETFEELRDRIDRTEEREIRLGQEAEKITFNEKGVIIPLKILNENQNFTYRITTEQTVDWITPDREQLEIKPQTTGTVNLAVAPTSAVREGLYEVSVGVVLEGREQLFTQTLLLEYDQSWLRKAWWWVIFAILGGLVLAGIVYYLKNQEKKELKKAPKVGL